MPSAIRDRLRLVRFLSYEGTVAGGGPPTGASCGSILQGAKLTGTGELVYCVIYRLLLFVSRSLNSKDVCVCVYVCVCV